MEEFMISKLLEGRPENISSQSEKDCYDLLDRLEIPYQRVDYNFYPGRQEDMDVIAEVLGVEAIKNLVFATRNRKTIVFVILPASQRFDLKTFRQIHHISKLHLITDEELKEILHTHAGAVSILELMYDKENRLELYLESSLLEKPFFRLHPGENHSMLRITTKDLMEKLIPSLHHPLHLFSNQTPDIPE